MDANSNPYEAPRHGDSDNLESNRKRGFCWWRFALFLCVAIALNVLRLAMTWKAYGTDGYEQVGWPWAFYERGGFSGGEHFYPLLLFVDCAIAIGLAYVGGRITARDVVEQIRRFQSWGTPQSP